MLRLPQSLNRGCSPRPTPAPEHPSNSTTRTASLLLTTSRLAVTLSDRDGNLTVKTLDGETLVRERGNLPRTYLPSEAAGLYHIEDRFSPDATEALYGLGQHQSGMFNYRGSVVELGQNNTDIAIPLLVSSKGYAILWNTASFSYVDNRFPLELNLESMAAPQIDYYVLYGPQMDAILHQYRSMTGHAPLFPEWAYGLFQSKDRYKTQPEILSIAAGYRARHIPMDAIVQDWFWWKDGGKGDPIFNSGYTDVPAELKTLHDEHVHAMISAWAMMDASAENFKQIVAEGLRCSRRADLRSLQPRRRGLFLESICRQALRPGVGRLLARQLRARRGMAARRRRHPAR